MEALAPAMVRGLFEQHAEMMAADPTLQYSYKMSFLEISMEKIKVCIVVRSVALSPECVGVQNCFP